MSLKSEAGFCTPDINVPRIWVRFLHPVHRSAPDLRLVFQTLGRLLPILISTDIIAGTCPVNAGLVAMTEDPCLRKTGQQFPDQFCHAPFLGHGARIGELSLYIQASLIADADRVRVNHCRETLSDVLDTDLKEGTE